MSVELLKFSDAPENEVLKVKPPEVAPDGDVIGEYKIEVQFAPGRSVSSLKPSLGILMVWQSGSALHGGGDELAYFCGNKQCDMPIKSEYFAHASIICPYCGVESFASQEDKKQHVSAARKMGEDVNKFKKMPVCYSEKMFRMSPPVLAKLVEKVWYQLSGNADIYMKFHASDIRFHTTESSDDINRRIADAHGSRVKGVYPLKNIMKDLEAGAEPWKRFMAFLTA